MTECFCVMSNEITGRIDPHFYRPEFLELEKQLTKSKHEVLGKIINFSSESWNQIDFFKTKFPYIEISEIDTTSGEIKNITYYEKKNAPSRAKMIVKEGDIIVSTTRPHRGAIALIDKEKDGYIASTGFAVLRDLKIELKKKYLLYVLRTQISLKQMLQRSSGGNYPAITQEELKKLVIPCPLLETQNSVVTLMDKAYSQKKQKESEALKLLDSINDYVLDELGIKLPELKDKMTYCITSKELKDNRIDVYYYQPRFKEIGGALKRGKFDLIKIGDKFDLLNQVGKFKDISEINYVDLSSIDKISGYVTKTKNMIVRDAPSRAKQKIEKGDLLISSLSGSLKSISVYDREDKNSVASTGFHIIRDSGMYNNYYLFALFRTPLFQNLIQRETTGAIMSAINRDSFKQIKIPLPPLSIQNKIADEVKKRMQKAEQLKKEAKEGLEKAKLEVEKIILNN